MKRTSIFGTFAVLVLAAISASAQRPAPGAAAPCCGITAINPRSGEVTAKVAATGKLFQFMVTNPQTLESLRIGQGVFANFAARQVSLDGRIACCQITGSSQVAVPGAPRPAVPQPAPLSVASAPAPRTATSAAPESQPSAPAESPAAPMSARATNAPLNSNGENRMTQAPAANNLAHSGVAASAISNLSMFNPCAGQNQTTTPKKTPSKTPAGLQNLGGTPTAAPGEFGDSICVGTPYKRTIAIVKSGLRYDQREVTATANGQAVKGTILHLRGLDGIQQAQAQGLIPKSVGDILSMHVRALPAGQSDHYLVNPDLAQAWSKTHPEPPLAAGKATDNHEGCSAYSMHCLGEDVEHAEGQVDQLRAQAQQEWQHMVGQAAQLYGESTACFEESNKTLAKVPIEFDEPFQANAPFSDSGKSGSFSGTVSGKIGLGFPVKTNLMTDVSVFYVECLPFMIRPRGVDGDGSVTAGTTFSAEVTATGKFEQNFPIYSTTPPIPIQVLPIIVAGVPLAEVDVSAYIEADVLVSVVATAEASYQVEHTHTINLQFSCDGGGCDGHETQGPTQTTTAKSAEIKGQATVTPSVYTALQFDFDFDALSARAGPKPALVAQVNGCAYVGEKTVSGGPSTTQHSQCLVADLDWKTDFVSQVLIGGKSVASQTNSLVGARHIVFDDLLPGGSTALIAGVTQVASPAAGQPVYFKVQMPQCYPYTDKIQYQVAWTGGGSGVPDPSACTWDNATGTGTCFADPTKQVEIGFQWPAGSHSLTVTPVHDQHPRDFKVALNPVSVDVGAGGVTASTLAIKP